MAYVLFSKLLQIMVKTTIMGKPKGTSCIHSREMTQESQMFLLLADWPSGSFLCTKLQHSHPFAYCARAESVPRTRTALSCVSDGDSWLSFHWGLHFLIGLENPSHESHHPINSSQKWSERGVWQRTPNGPLPIPFLSLLHASDLTFHLRSIF